MGKLPSQEYIPQTEVCPVSLGSSNPNENLKNLHLCLTGNLGDTVAVAPRLLSLAVVHVSVPKCGQEPGRVDNSLHRVTERERWLALQSHPTNP